MQFEDRITIATPEGVHLELVLAGVGSRFTAAIVDFLIQAALLGALLIAFAASGLLEGFGAAAATILSFLLFAGYDVFFEVLASGRTPGKRMNGLRVVRSDGSPVTFLTSAVRNTLRLVDILPFAYLVGIVSVLATRRNQRLGDLAAGTIVVRERLGISPGRRRPTQRAGPAQPAAPTGRSAPDAATWDTSAVTAAEVLAVRRFLERRLDLAPEAREQLAGELSAGLLDKVAGVPEWVKGEEFLEALAAAKASRG